MSPQNIMNRFRQTQLSSFKWLAPVLLALAVTLLYGQFFNNPLVFDDDNFFNGVVHEEYQGKIFSFDLRWLPYATFEWTRYFLGLELKWFRLGNMLLHILTCIVLYFFLRCLFERVLTKPETEQNGDIAAAPLSLTSQAFFGALLFALHPASVYATGYLIERTIIMATLFVLIMWWLFLEGLIRRSLTLLFASAIAYFFAIHSKEHAIMAPAVSLALLFLVDKPKQLLKLVWPVFVLYAFIGALVVWQIKSTHVLAQAYEPNGLDLLSRIGNNDAQFNPRLAYPLSVITQAYLFFKYLLVWGVPSSAWMSIDMYEPFAHKLLSWPQTLGFAAFIFYPIVMVRLLLKRGSVGLFSFAMLCPWLLFATELSTIRIHESFVIYRSYLWMACSFAGLPFLFQRISAKRAMFSLSFIALVLFALSYVRLITFSQDLLLWDDAARLVKGKENYPGVERIYHNRGVALLMRKDYPAALDDFNRAIKIFPGNPYIFNARGTAYLETAQYNHAVNDFTHAIALSPYLGAAYLGRARGYEKLTNISAARQDYQRSCSLGVKKACERLNVLSN